MDTMTLAKQLADHARASGLVQSRLYRAMKIAKEILRDESPDFFSIGPGGQETRGSETIDRQPTP